MKILKKQSSTTIAVILMLSIAISLLASVQIVTATDYNTWTFMSIVPSPVGVGQTAHATVWLDRYPPSHATPGTGLYVLDATWEFEVKITDPDGNVQTKNLKADFIGGAYFDFVPTTAGTYTFDATFKENTGQVLTNGSLAGNKYLSSTRTGVKLVVQQEPIPTYPGAPLPTQYWERPIDAQNREWNSISGNWEGNPKYGGSFGQSNNWIKVGSGPNSAHILWTRDMEIGGLVGGEGGSESFYGGLSYESKWSPPVIIGPYLYHNQRLGSSGSLGLECVDLRTGERVWFQNGTSISFGQVLQYESMNQHGAIPYLWQTGATYRMFDAFSGTEILRISNASTGRNRIDENGNLLVYILNGANNWFAMWNSTKCILNYSSQGADYWRPPTGGDLDWKRGIQWNYSVPDVAGSQSIATIGDKVIIASVGYPGLIGMIGYSMQPTGPTAVELWRFNVTNSFESASYFQSCEVDGKFAWFRQELMSWYGYDAMTGKQLWGPTTPYENDWGFYTSGGGGIGASSPVIAYGKLYAATYDGRIHCFDMETGDNLWNYYIGNAGFETPYGTWAIGMGQPAAIDGKIYAACGEHSPTGPLWRGQKLVCINATTGEEIWHVLGWDQGPFPIADGKLVTFNLYDSRIYCFGKGPSAVTVSAPDVAVTAGTPVVIKGTVIDKSVGAMKGEPFGRYPNGVPAISDESQSDWMAHVFMDQPLPTNATGVEVTIDVFDSNGNYRTIGTTTSDLSGFYSFTWEPDISGDFKVIATFHGSESYYGSYAETAFTATEAPSQPAPEEPVQPTMSETYFVPAVVGIIVVLIIGFALVAILLLRKRQ